jgi:hypothetical protein
MPITLEHDPAPIKGITIDSDFASGSLTITTEPSSFGHEDGDVLFTARGSLNGTAGRVAEPNHIRIRGRQLPRLIEYLQTLADQKELP